VTEASPHQTNPDPAGQAPAFNRPRPTLRQRLSANPATSALILLTALVFLAQWASQLLLDFDLVLALGAKANAPIRQGQWWRLFTPIFLHVGALHLFVNMYSLYVIGPAVEQPFGGVRYMVVYLLSGLSGVAFSLAFSSQPSAGASGAVFGLLGALAGFLFQHRNLLSPAGRGQLRHIVFLAAINLLIGLSPGIDNWGHLGGLVCGLGLSFWLGPRFEMPPPEVTPGRPRDARPWSRVWRRSLAALLGVVLLVAAAIGSPFGS
jgi:rhomboid protease GluP